MVESTTNGGSRGFASMGADKQKEIARKGGKAAHAKGTAHEFTPEEARQAGKKGGESVSTNREHMSRIGRLGGKRSASRRQSLSEPENKQGNCSTSRLDPESNGISSGERSPEDSAMAARPGNGAQ